jgi:hypothetical protein
MPDRAWVLDAQSVKTSANVPVGGQGIDAGKKITGRKRHIGASVRDPSPLTPRDLPNTPAGTKHSFNRSQLLGIGEWAHQHLREIRHGLTRRQLRQRLQVLACSAGRIA